MADRREWIISLNAIREVLASELKPELPSARSREAVENVDMTLARMIADLESGPGIAEDRLEQWRDLRGEFAAIAGSASAPGRIVPVADRFESLEAVMAELQRDVDRLTPDADFLHDLATAGSPTDRWFSRAAQAMLDFASAYEATITPAPLPEPQQDLAVEEARLRAALNAYLPRKFPQLPADPVLSLHLATGGLGKRTALFRLVDNPVLPTRLVLRGDISTGTTHTTVVREFPLLQEVHARGLPVPRPLLLEADAAVIGGAFILVTEIEDATLAGFAFVEDRRMQRAAHPVPDAEFARELARTLARLHAIRHMPGTAVEAGNAAPQWTTPDAMIADWLKSWQTSEKGPFSLVTDLSFAWLRAHPLPADRPRSVIHGDVSAHNILVRNGRLAALLDWETAREGDPAEDLGYCRLLLIEGVLPWQDFIAEYLSAGGDPRACDPQAVNFWAVWTWAMAAARVTVVRQLLSSGVRSDIRASNYAWHFFLRMQYYGARELARAVKE